MKNILFFVSWYNPYSLIGSFFMEQAEYLSEKNNHIYFVFETKDKNYLNKIIEINEKIFLIGVNPLRESHNYGVFQNVIAKLDKNHFLKTFGELFQGIQFNGAIAQNIDKAGYLVYWLNRTFKIPYVIVQHNPLFFEDLEYYRSFKNIRRILRESYKNFFVSHDLIRQFRNQGVLQPMAKIINPLGLRTEGITIRNSSNLDDSKGVTIGLSGQYGYIKNQKLLFDALELLNGVLSMPVKVIWLGYASWDITTFRVSLASELALDRFNDNFEFDFYDKVNRNEMAIKLSDCDFFVSTSFNETFGITQLEALSLGVPVLTTQNGGCNEFMNEQNGYVVNSFEPKDFADALLLIIKNLGRFDPQMISERVRRDFSKDVYLGQLCSVPFLN